MTYVVSMLACVAIATAADGSDVRVAEAKKYFDAGRQAYELGYYVQAASAFQHAWELAPRPAIAFSMAQAWRLQYFVDREPAHLRRAIDLYHRYLEYPARDLQRREDAIEHLTDLEKRLSALPLDSARATAEAKPAVTQIMVVSRTPGATAAIDHGRASEVPAIREIVPGKHAITVDAPGFLEQTVEAIAVEGQLVVTEVTLEERLAAATVRAPGGAQIFVDGLPMGAAPLVRPLALAAGRHIVSVTELGHEPFAKVLELVRGEEVELEVELETTTRRVASYYVLAAGGAGILTGAALIGVGFAREAQARLILRETNPPNGRNLTRQELEKYISARETRDDLLVVSTVFVAAGFAAAAIGAYLHFVDSPGSFATVAPATNIAPIVGANAMGAMVQTTF